MKGRLVQYTGGLALLLILLMTAGCNLPECRWRENGSGWRSDDEQTRFWPCGIGRHSSLWHKWKRIICQICPAQINGIGQELYGYDNIWCPSTSHRLLYRAWHTRRATSYLYCQGRIYQNKGDDDMAMQCFILGKEHCKGISDTLTLANLMVAQASIQYSIYKYKQQS